ncbi:MAG: tetratricopeptide repeat protein [Myxococcaceae bacterium]|nr:tetratricopeptide repeat protein [Myxococcaceae bacterium]MCI0669609.1 tetratricopeptide repeat protein [Myxococcaceae bacterium]
MGRSVFEAERTRLWLGVLLLGLGSACATGQLGTRNRPVQTLVNELKKGGWEPDNPFSLDPQDLEVAHQAIGMYGSSADRLQRTVNYLNSASGIGFQYSPNVTLTAREALRARTGDCMTYASLLVAIARTLVIPAYFVYVSELPVHYDSSGWLYSASHIAVALDVGSGALVVDLLASREEWPGSVFRKVDDGVAASLFFTNRAVERLVRGDTAGAEQMLRTVLAFAPEVREPWVNLGVVLLRRQQAKEALALLRESLKRFPDYQPLWTNAVRAARALGDEAMAKQLETEAERVAKRDPYFHFMRGVAAYQSGDFASAITSLETAVEGMAEGSLVRAWLVRAYLSGGEHKKGWELFATLRKEAPKDPLLDTLTTEFPRLALLDVGSTSTEQAVRLLGKARRKKP